MTRELDLCQYSTYRHGASHCLQMSSAFSFTGIPFAKKNKKNHHHCIALTLTLILTHNLTLTPTHSVTEKEYSIDNI